MFLTLLSVELSKIASGFYWDESDVESLYNNVNHKTDMLMKVELARNIAVNQEIIKEGFGIK